MQRCKVPEDVALCVVAVGVAEEADDPLGEYGERQAQRLEDAVTAFVQEAGYEPSREFQCSLL